MGQVVHQEKQRKKRQRRIENLLKGQRDINKWQRLAHK
jgi:hypothetical protein